jgi:hypothetical protein
VVSASVRADFTGKQIIMMRISAPHRGVIFVGTILYVISAGLSSCKNTESDIGSSFFKSHSNVAVIDTVTATVSTVYLDSVYTNGTGVILTGNTHDTLAGNQTASSYMQLGAPTVQSIPTTAVYDSLCFVLQPNRYVYGDSTSQFSFSVHALQELITPPNNGTLLYNTSSFSYDPTALGAWKGRIYPTRTDSLSVRLSDVLGTRLFDAIVDNPAQLATDNLFVHNYLKGVVLVPGNDQAAFGFRVSDSSGLMRLYYHDVSNAKRTQHTDFRVTQTSLQFNHVSNDRSQTPFSALSSGNKLIAAGAAKGVSVLQPLGNLAIRIDFPYLQNLLHLARYVQVLNASMVLRPVPGTYSADRPLPPALSLAVVTDYHSVIDSLTGATGVQHGNLKTDYAYSNSYYTYDISSYLINEINVSSNYNKTALMLIPPAPAYRTSFQRLVIGSPSALVPGVQVKIQLAMYNDN